MNKLYYGDNLEVLRDKIPATCDIKISTKSKVNYVKEE